MQGPYRLTGQDNNQFVTILAGTERVFIDGVRMVRGEQNDYIIDYGLGEITFTNNRVITDQRRIVVDYQYIEQDYTRSLVAAEAKEDELLGGRLSVAASYIREADSDNLQSQFALSENEVEQLRQAGDEPALVSGADSVGFSPTSDFLLYARIDTTFNGQPYTIFKHLPGDSASVFRVRFSRVNEGTGSYTRVGRASNGILYEWVGPGGGNYEPFRRLAPPQAQQMISLRSKYRAGDHVELFGEVSGSDFDQNRFSSIDDGDNFDQAYYGGVRIKKLPTSLGTVRLEATQRYSGRRFQFFDRTRQVEFNRKWNITGDIDNIQERITEATVGLSSMQATDVAYSFGTIDRDNLKSSRHQLTVASSEKNGPDISYRAEFIDSRDLFSEESGLWFRQLGNSSYDISLGNGTLTPLFGYEGELRRQKAFGTDSLGFNSLRFWDVQPGLQYQYNNLLLGVRYSVRDDDQALGGTITNQSLSTTQTYIANFKTGPGFSMDNEVSFRRRNFTEAFEEERGATDSRGVIIRSNARYRVADNLVSGQLLYEAITKREAILQETFLEVGPEFGQYVWEDLNGDNVQQINEFFIEQIPNEGIFIKQFVPSDELFPVIDLRTRVRNRIQPANVVRTRGWEGFWARALSQIELNSIFEIRESNRTEQIRDIYLLKLSEFRDRQNTVDGRLYWQQELRLFPDEPKYDIRLKTNQVRSLNQRAAGFEEVFTSNYELETSYRLKRRYILKNLVEYGENRNVSERLTNRNFDIRYYRLQPGFDLLLNRSLQAGGLVEISRKEDRRPDQPTEVRLFRVETNLRAYLFRKVQTNARLSWRDARVEGESTTFGIFELTDGAGVGSTWNWSLQGSYRISDLLRASINYDGRTLQGRGLIQTMRVVVSAVF